jgi:hypothetical protein
MKMEKIDAIIEHITITTGARRMSKRSEVADTVVDIVRRAIAHDGGKLWSSGWTVTLLPSSDGGFVFDLAHDKARVVRSWLCVDDTASKSLWQDAMSWSIDPQAILPAPKRTPWLAAALDIKTFRGVSPPILMEAGDLERCVAWALI